jgi:glycosyltransferase involved in cell wall biosynthesis
VGGNELMEDVDYKSEIGLSVVLPVYNEEENIRPLYKELIATLGHGSNSYEIVFVDDGSTDKSLLALKEIQSSDPKVRVVQFRKNFGQTASLAAGINLARGAVVVTLDADLQNDPADIPKMLEELKNGYDLVCGWRTPRKDSFLFRTMPSKIANFFIGMLTDVKLHDYGCTLKVMQRDVAKSLKLYGEMHRLIPALASSYGVAICEVKVNHRPRIAGESKYGMARTFGVILDVLTVKFFLSYSSRPIQLFGGIGLLSGFVGSSILGWYGFQKLAFGLPLNDRPALLLAILLVVAGLQFITFGLLAELQIRTYHESQNKPTYAIRKIYQTIENR